MTGPPRAIRLAAAATRKTVVYGADACPQVGTAFLSGHRVAPRAAHHSASKTISHCLTRVAGSFHRGGGDLISGCNLVQLLGMLCGRCDEQPHTNADQLGTGILKKSRGRM